MQVVFLLFIAFIIPHCTMAQAVVPQFSTPDTVCVNNPLTITNTSSGASGYFWNFCVADVNAQPAAANLGNPGGYLSQPVFVDLVEDNGNYYGFVVNHYPGGITRLDFGNSLLNTPNPVFLGNISGVMNKQYGSEGIQVIKTNGKWYGVLVGGTPASGTGGLPKLITIYFGTKINNAAPTAVNWGNLGKMLESIDLHIFQENGVWYGFTVNAENNTITRINFTSSFDNPPTAINLGNIGGLNYPTGVYAINDNGAWRVFVTNEKSQTVTRLDFGSSLLNTPTGINLGNPGNAINAPRDISILKYCGQSVGFVVNGTNSITRLNFSALSAVPIATSLGNLGNLSFPHSLSKLFRVGNDIYSLITNVSNNTITRLKFTGCTSSNVPSSTVQDPPPVVYNAPGVYNINLTVDDGLPTQASVCKQVVVVPAPVHSPTRYFSGCGAVTLKIGASIHPATYTWSTGAVSDSIFVTAPGVYWVESALHGCGVRDSFIVSVPATALYDCDAVKITGPDKVCSQLDTISYAIYRSPGCTQQYALQADYSMVTIVAQTPASLKLLFKHNGTAHLKVSYINNCKIVADSISIAIQFSPAGLSLGHEIITCGDTAFTLHAGSGFTAYEWQDQTTDSILLVKTPGTYSVTAQNQCDVQFTDTLRFTNRMAVPMAVTPSAASVCTGDSIMLYASGGTTYSWQPAASFNHPYAATVKALANASQSFRLFVHDAICMKDSTFTIPVIALPGATIIISKSNDVSCGHDSAVLTANGGVAYAWSANVNTLRPVDKSIIVKPPQTTMYHVYGKDAAGCTGQDSVSVIYLTTAQQQLHMPNAFTPNGNGSNDVFRPVFSGPVIKYNFIIYNRWGQQVFRSATPGAGWNGTFNGNTQPAGTFVYYVIAEGSCNGKFEQKGTFVLIR